MKSKPCCIWVVAMMRKALVTMLGGGNMEEGAPLCSHSTGVRFLRDFLTMV